MAVEDVDMKASDTDKDKSEEGNDDSKSAKEELKPVPLSPVDEIKNNVLLIERAVSTLEPRFTHRVLRSFFTLRKKLNSTILRDAITAIYTNSAQIVPIMLNPQINIRTS